MTDTHDPKDGAAALPQATGQGSRDRVTEITHLFDEIRTLVASKIEEEGPVTGAMIKALLSKVGELQSAHLMVLQAEEKFHDKFAETGGRAGPNYDEISDDIGRALDRIRAAADADDLSEGPGA